MLLIGKSLMHSVAAFALELPSNVASHCWRCFAFLHDS
jgi:hypothetical protein